MRGADLGGCQPPRGTVKERTTQHTFGLDRRRSILGRFFRFEAFFHAGRGQLCRGIGGIELAILTALNGDYGGTADAMTLGAFALLAVVLTGVPFLLWLRAISMIGAVNVMPFILLTPVTALVIDAVVKSVVPTPLQMLGIVVVIAALLLNYRASQPKA